MRPAGVADPEVGRWLAGWNEIRRATNALLDEIPPEAIDADLGDGGDTLGTVLFHVADAEVWWIHRVLEGRPLDDGDQALLTHQGRDGDDPLTHVTGESMAEHRQRLDKRARVGGRGAGAAVERGLQPRPRARRPGRVGQLDGVPPDRPRVGPHGADPRDPGRVPARADGGGVEPRLRDVLDLPDGVADPEVGRWLSAFAEVRRDTDKILDQIRPEAIDADLGDGGDTLGTVLYHTALVEIGWVFWDVLDREADIPKSLFPHDDRVVDGRLTPVLGETLEQHRRAARPGARDGLAGAGFDVERGRSTASAPGRTRTCRRTGSCST